MRKRQRLRLERQAAQAGKVEGELVYSRNSKRWHAFTMLVEAVAHGANVAVMGAKADTLRFIHAVAEARGVLLPLPVALLTAPEVDRRWKAGEKLTVYGEEQE